VTISRHELDDVERANKAAVTPVVLVHGLWVSASSWLPWRGHLEAAGFATIAPRYPGEPDSVPEARSRPRAMAGLGVASVTGHVAEVVAALDRAPVLVGHSVGGLVAQQLAGRGLARGTVAIAPAPFRGVLPLPVTTLRTALPVVANPANRHRSVRLTRERFRYVFANAVSREESDRLYDEHCVPAPARPLFQVATANVHPGTEARVDTGRPGRGPLMVVSAERDNAMPWAIASATYRRQSTSASPTELTQAPGRGHSLVLDDGWAEVAENVLAFLARHGIRP
jgi:pimeloyl-ACP methyl ester carboxylesterase